MGKDGHGVDDAGGRRKAEFQRRVGQAVQQGDVDITGRRGAPDQSRRAFRPEARRLADVVDAETLAPDECAHDVAAGERERLLLEQRMNRGSLREQRSPIGALLASVRSVVAGLLLIFPGVITDVLAVLLLVWPLPKGRPLDGEAPPGAIEGEYRREPTDRLPPRR